jgi:hypothetical protein
MFSDKVVTKMGTVIHGARTKIKQHKPKPEELRKLEIELASKNYFESVILLQTHCVKPTEDLSDKIEVAKDIF